MRSALLLLGLGPLCSSRPQPWRGIRAPLGRLEGELSPGPADAHARATRTAFLEQLRGALRRPELVLNHDIRLEELRHLAQTAASTFPTEVFEARPLERSGSDTSSDLLDELEPSSVASSAARRLWRRLQSVLADPPDPPEPEHPRVLEPLRACPGYSPGLFFAGTPNLGLLTHCALTLSLAAYGLSLRDKDQDDDRLERAGLLADLAMGELGGTRRWLLRSRSACGIAVLDGRGVLAVAFRGTLDPSDLLTDVSFAPAPIDTQGVLVHGGFLDAFSGLLPQLENLLAELASAGPLPRLVFTGHSMGGALAQLAAAHYRRHSPWLITFGAPCVGNSAFKRLVETGVRPFGGVRLWNELDSVPYLALLVGYCHAGVPVKLRLSSLAKEVVVEQLGREGGVNVDLLGAVCPHIVYHIGLIVYVFPILGTNATITRNVLTSSPLL